MLFYHRIIPTYLLLIVLLLFGSCTNDGDIREARSVLERAIDGMYGDSQDDDWFALLDFGCDLSPEQRQVFAQAYGMFGNNESVVRCHIDEHVDVVCDSVLVLYYSLYFADGDSLACSQKMVRRNGLWKVRMRE